MGNKEMTLEELRGKLETIRKEYNSLQETVKQKEIDEETKRKTELATKKDERKKEIEVKSKELKTLVMNYLKDYGSLSLESDEDDYRLSFLNPSSWF